jgi:hypothetical protein
MNIVYRPISTTAPMRLPHSHDRKLRRGGLGARVPAGAVLVDEGEAMGVSAMTGSQ